MTYSINNSKKVHFGATTIHPIDCTMTKVEKFATWYSLPELKSIKDNIRKICEYVEYGLDAGMFYKTESIRGLEKVMNPNRKKMAKRKRNILWAVIELQDAAGKGFPDERTIQIKNTLECYVQKHQKQAADMATSRAQEDRQAAQEIYNEVAPVVEMASKKQPSSSGHCYVPVVRRQFGEARIQTFMAAVSA